MTRFLLVDIFHAIPRCNPLVQWLRPVNHGTPDRDMARHVCEVIALATPKPTFKGVRVTLRSVNG